MRHRFRDTFIDGKSNVAGDIFTPKEKSELAPGDEVEYFPARKLSARRFPATVESVTFPYVIRLRSAKEAE